MHTTKTYIALALSLILTACNATSNNTWQNTGATRPAQEEPSNISIQSVGHEALSSSENDGLPTVKVAILLPLSGQHAKLGHAMLNAAQIALFDLGFDNFTLLPKDTRGTPDGAATATREALKDEAQLILGPVFSGSVRAAQKLTGNTPIIAFSTDWTLANRKTFLIGFLPFDQVARVTSFAASKNLTRQSVFSPKNTYGDGVVAAYKSVAPQIGIQSPRIERFTTEGKDLAIKMELFADQNKNAIDAVLLPMGGALARQVGSFLNHYDMPPRTVRRLGTGLMDDAALANDSTLAGAWFAAPSPKAHAKFERRYHGIYGKTPPRIASLAYDATALSAILAKIGIKQTGRPAYTHKNLTNPNGFAGVDGIFRFRPDGISERGLAVLEYKNKRIVEIDPAPTTFKQQNF